MKTFTKITVILFAAITLKAQTLEWSYHNIIAGWTYNVPNAMAVDNSGNVYVTGRKLSSNTAKDYFVYKLNQNGTLVWQNTYDGISHYNDEAFAIAVDNSGNVYITGSSDDSSGYYTDIVTIKYSSSGSLVWVRKYDGPESFDDVGKKIVIDNSGNIIVAGTSFRPQTQTDYIALKYNPAGTLLWQARYNGAANSYDELHDMKLTSSGDIIVTGSSVATGAGNDFLTVRFSGANGTKTWEARFNNNATQGNPDEALALAVAPNGSVIVTGRSNSTNGGWDILTQCYEGSNGTQLWTSRYDGTDHSWDQPVDICCDKFNNVFVTGYTHIAGYSYTAVIKYNQAGGISWTKLHQETSTTTEYPGAITVDSSGNAYVTIETNGDGYIINMKLNSSSGSIMWQDNYSTSNYSKTAGIIVDQSFSIFVTTSFGVRSNTIKYSQPLGIQNRNNNTARDFRLGQNYPNPFNPSTTIKFNLAESGSVKITVFDITGKLVSTLTDGYKNAGNHELKFDASNLSSGTYFYKMETEGFTDVKKMMLVK